MCIYIYIYIYTYIYYNIDVELCQSYPCPKKFYKHHTVPVVLRKCSADPLGHGHRCECHSPRMICHVTVAFGVPLRAVRNGPTWEERFYAPPPPGSDF